MFAVANIDETVDRLRAYGGNLMGEIAQYEDIYRFERAKGDYDCRR